MLSDPERYKRFNEMFNAIPMEEVHRRNAEEVAKNKDDFEKLKKGLSEGKCSYCGYTLDHFSVHKPCLHWLLKPKGFKKKHFPLLYAERGFHQLEAYLRWVANTEEFATNINDLVEERSSQKVIEETIRYKNLEWSFSSSKRCFDGLPHSHGGKFPHYHFQMKVDGLVIINYNGFHLPFNDYDDFSFAVKEGKFDRLKSGHLHGAGMQTMMDSLESEQALNALRRTDDESKGQFHIQTFIKADDEAGISGDELAAMFEESKRTGIPLRRLAQRLKSVQIQTVFEPGPAVPDIAARTPNRGGKSKS